MRNYISKINDRNLQRKRESGLTTYALISVLFFSVYKVFEIYPLVPFKLYFWDVLFQLTYSINVVFSIIIICSIYELTLGHLSSIRIVSKSSTKETLLETAIENSLIFIPFTFNLTATLYSIIVLKTWNWYFLIIAVTLLYAVTLLIYFSIKNRKVNKPYEIFEGTGKTGSDKDFISILLYVLCICCISFSFLNIYKSNVVFSKTTSLFFGIICYSIPFLITKIIALQKSDKFSISLENLEYEINVRDLKDEEIRVRLQKNYMGFLLIEWISYNSKHLERFKNIIETKKKDIVELKTQLISIDVKTYPIEHKGRSAKITERQNDITRLTDSFFNSKLNEIESIWTNSKLEAKERSELSKLYNKVKAEQEKYKA